MFFGGEWIGKAMQNRTYIACTNLKMNIFWLLLKKIRYTKKCILNLKYHIPNPFWKKTQTERGD